MNQKKLDKERWTKEEYDYIFNYNYKKEYHFLFQEIPTDDQALVFQFLSNEEKEESEQRLELIERLKEIILEFCDTSLTEREKQIYQLIFREGLNQRDAAKKLGIKQSCISNTIRAKMPAPKSVQGFKYKGIIPKIVNHLNQNEESISIMQELSIKPHEEFKRINYLLPKYITYESGGYVARHIKGDNFTCFRHKDLGKLIRLTEKLWGKPNPNGGQQMSKPVVVKLLNGNIVEFKSVSEAERMLSIYFDYASRSRLNKGETLFKKKMYKIKLKEFYKADGEF